MFDARDFEGIAEVVETYAILADSEAELDRFNGLKPFDVAFPGSDESGYGMEDSQRSWLVDGAELGFGLV